VRTNRNIIGRLCIVRDLKQKPFTYVEAMVIDKGPGGMAKRIRLQTGEHFGEVRMPQDYEVIEFVEPGEAPDCLAAAWPQ
jgi:hypothetical protein